MPPAIASHHLALMQTENRSTFIVSSQIKVAANTIFLHGGWDEVLVGNGQFLFEDIAGYSDHLSEHRKVRTKRAYTTPAHACQIPRKHAKSSIIYKELNKAVWLCVIFLPRHSLRTSEPCVGC